MDNKSAMIIHRLWFYYRYGISNYVSLIIQAINAIILVYFVAGDYILAIRSIFPHILYFILFIVIVGFPLITLFGKLHFKHAYKSESDILTSQNPYTKKIELPLYKFLINELLEKNPNDPELKKIKALVDKISNGGRLDD